MSASSRYLYPFSAMWSFRPWRSVSYTHLGAILGESETWARVTFYRAKEKLKEGGGSGC